ncbi:hypothetical protein ABL78_5730 [Leptomonas seymouri]|uniref:Uncharacterized protein n=1 Tax=Leptomonas seymouri TaxID=5684 RepID=A0A0N1PCE8_LEPSE|nr:hypothetical protein ABL78_5730 [Leptomonas seymouri]|eukprot:KPI85222.1 hypothetical protein ABL78_5730 [Leptomonas seymouri]
MLSSTLRRVRTLALVLMLLAAASPLVASPTEAAPPEPRPHPDEKQLPVEAHQARSAAPNASSIGGTGDEPNIVVDTVGSGSESPQTREDATRGTLADAEVSLGATHASSRRSRPPRCTDLFFRTATVSSAEHPDGGDALLRQEECRLLATSSDVLGGDRWQVFRRASTLGPATAPSTQEHRLVAVWQLGPHTPATQPLLENTFHTYFMNLSSSSSLGGPQLELEENAAPNSGSGAARQLARRLRAYSTLYTPRNVRHHSASGVPVVRRHSMSSGDQVRDAHYSWVSGALGTAHAVLLSCWDAATLALHRLGALDHAQQLFQEAYHNARVHRWMRWTTWKHLYYTRQLVLRFPVGSYEDPRRLGTAAAAEEEGELLSRMHLATRSSLTLLRVISFPPVAHAAPHAVHYRCALSAIPSASLVLQEEAMVQHRMQAKQQKGGGGRASYAPTAQHSTPAITAAAPPSPMRRTLISYVLDLAMRLARRLFSTEKDSLDSRGGSSDGADSAGPASASCTRNAGSAAAHWSPPAVYAARAFLQRVREELGPYQSSAVSSLPMGLQQLIGSRVIGTKTQLIEEVQAAASAAISGGGGAADHERQWRTDAFMEWTATLPAGTPMCLALIALPRSDGLLEASELHLRVEEALVFDQLWMLLLLSAFAALQLERRVAQSAVARHIVTGLTGTLLLCIAAVFYVLRELQRMSVGKLAVVAAVVLGGSTAALEGIFSVLWSYYNLDSLWASTSASHALSERADLLALALLVVGLLFVLNDFLFNLLVPAAYLSAVTRWSVRALLVLLWWMCLRRNAEATLTTVLLYVLLSKARWLPSCLLQRRLTQRETRRQPHQHGQQPPTPSCSDAWRIEDPLQDIPGYAQQARAYVRPFAVVDHGDYDKLRTAESRFKKFEEDGANSTRRALEELAAHLRAHPGKYAMRLRDPNGVQRWAGTSDSTARESETSGSD